jgi:chemotaxis-related protein WspB
MLFLLCEVAGARYALDVRLIVEVLPIVEIQQVPHAPAAISGLINHRGKPLPVVDLSMLVAERRSSLHLTSRIVILDLPVDGTARLVGLLAEHAIQTAHYSESAFVASGIRSGRAACHQRGAGDGGSVIQWLDVDDLLTPTLRQALFAEPAAGSR